MNAGELIIKTKLDTKDFTAQINNLEKEVAMLEKSLSDTSSMKPYKGQKEDVEYLTIQLEKARNKLAGFQQQQNKINEQGFEKSNISLKNIGSAMQNVLKTVSKWALALIGIRSLYSGIRSAISSVSQYNEQISADLEYMRYGIAMALTPLVENLVRLLYQGLAIIRQMVMAVSGFDIFANAGAEGFKKANASASQLKRTLTGFDEMNVLSDNSTTGGSSSNIKPSEDLSKIKTDFKLVETLGEKLKNTFNVVTENIIKNVEKIAKELGINGFLVKSWELAVKGLENTLYGLIDIVIGVFKIISGIVTGDTELVVKGIKNIVKGLGEILLGILEMVIGVIGTMIGWVLEPFNQLNKFIKKTYELAEQLGETIGKNLKQIFENVVIGIETAWKKIKNLFSTGGEIFNGIKTGIENTFKKLLNGLIEGLNTVLNSAFKKLNEVFNNLRSIEVLGKKPFSSLYSKNPLPTIKIPKLARGGIVNNPGSGVMMGNYIAGEHGSEAILPLQDPQSLAMIGEAIGRYVTINANIVNSMNGRVINRQLKKVSADSDFAFNR